MGTETSETDTDDTEMDTDTSETSESREESAEMAEMRARLSKANREAAKQRLRLKELEDRDKTELQKLTDERDELRKEALAGLRWKVALEKGLTVTQAKRLVGDTYDELIADADELVTDLGVKPAGDETDETSTESDDGTSPSPASRPREDLKPGSGATDAADTESTTDIKAIGARMFGR